MVGSRPTTILCLASYEKGHDFIRECKQQGCRVLLLTQPDLRDAEWPREAIDEIFFLADMYNRHELITGVSYLARTERIDRIAALDDFDVEMAAALREHLRVPGIGDTVARYFRDKLAMRFKAREEGFLVPDFVPVLHHETLREWMEHVPAPWVLKPRSEASAVGIKIIHAQHEMWSAIDQLGDRQSFYLVEQYISGPVYHVDSIVVDNDVVFAEAQRYAVPLLDVVQGGGIFSSRTLPRGEADDQALKEVNRRLLKALGLQRGVAHTEFIKGNDGKFYFLETSARVGGANIAELVEAATGVNLWREWAKIEVGSQPYSLPPTKHEYAGVIISLARQDYPDMSAYSDSEVVWRLNKRHHAGLVVASADFQRVYMLLEDYLHRFANDFYTSLPEPEKPTS